MIKQKNSHNIQAKNNHYSFILPIITFSIPMLIEQREKTESSLKKTSDFKPKPKKLIITKYELSEDVVKFFGAKGVFKKRWVILKEIPIIEITKIECLGKELILSLRGEICSFIFKQKSESFDNLRDQILSLLEAKQKNIENKEDNNQIPNELTEIIEATMGVVDLSFDILFGLHTKRVNWTHLETCAESLGSSLTFNGQIMPSLNLNFEKVLFTIKNQNSKEISKEIFSCLKEIYGYFDDLKPYTELNGKSLNFKKAKAMILVYYMLNDLLLGKVVGEKNDKTEREALESVLRGLTNEENEKIDSGVFYSAIDRLDVEGESESVIEEARAIFRGKVAAV